MIKFWFDSTSNMLAMIRARCLLAVVLFALKGTLMAQHADAFFDQTQFATWASQAPQEQVFWKTEVEPAGLTLYQRIGAYVLIHVDGRYLKHRHASGELLVLLEVTDAAGRKYQDHTNMPVDSKDPTLSKGRLFEWRMFVLPGDYDVAFAVLDSVSGKHSFARRKLHIDALSKDPLPDAWRDLPTLEFLKLKEESPEIYFHPEAKARLRLPLVTRRPVRIEVLASLTGTGRAMVSHRAYDFNLGALLPVLKTLSQVEVQGGTLNIETLDLIRRQVPFRQENIARLDWPLLNEAVKAADPTKIDFHALQDSRHTAAFLRGEVARRIGSVGGDQDPLPVLVLISAAAFFNSLDHINDTLLPKQCNCRVYYIRYSPSALRYRFSSAAFDNVRRVLKPLPVQAHYAESPQDLRRILAEIMEEVSRM